MSERQRDMVYIASLLVGLVVGIGYGLINLRSPAPPIAALVGLLAMLAGENAVVVVKGMFSHGSTPTTQAAKYPD